jgi:hypothetical protein
MVAASCSPKRDMSDCRATAAWLSSRDSLSRSLRGSDVSLDESRRALDGSSFPGGNSVSSCLRGSPERGAVGSRGEDVIKDIYRRHASSFFDELRTWFTKETRSLRNTAEKQLEVDQLRSLRLRVEQLEANTVVHMPTFAGDAAAGSATSRSISPTSRDGQASAASLRALCREEARCALEELRGELLGGDLLCDELLSGGDGLRPALERLIGESSTANAAKRETALSAQVAELRASIDGATAAATAAATAEIGRLDNAFRASLAAEVRELGSLCESVRTRIEALDESAADHIGRLSARIAELEETSCAPSRAGSVRTDASTAATVGSAKDFTQSVGSGKEFTHSVGSAKDDVGFSGNVHRPGASFVDRSSAGQRQNTGNAQSPRVSMEREEVSRSTSALTWQPMQAPSTATVDTSLPPFCASLSPLNIGSCPGKSPVPQGPSTPPKRHVPPGLATASRTSPGAGSTMGSHAGHTETSRRHSVGGHKETQPNRSKQWSSRSPSPRMEARGGC